MQRYNIWKRQLTFSHVSSRFVTYYHVFSRFLASFGLGLAQKEEETRYLHGCELLASPTVSCLPEFPQKVGIALNPTLEVSTCHGW